MLQETFKDDCISRSQSGRWHKAFKEGREEVADEPRSGRPTTARTDENVNREDVPLGFLRRLSTRSGHPASSNSSEGVSILKGDKGEKGGRWISMLTVSTLDVSPASSAISNLCGRGGGESLKNSELTLPSSGQRVKLQVASFCNLVFSRQ
ncbi:GVQW3 protein, partial [Acromyrmex insinuator]